MFLLLFKFSIDLILSLMSRDFCVGVNFVTHNRIVFYNKNEEFFTQSSVNLAKTLPQCFSLAASV